MDTSSLGGASTVDHLDVESLPRGTIARLGVIMAHDGLGQPMRLPMLVARGDRPGPVFGITAAVHGNELNGIPVIHRLFERIDARTLKGTLAAIVVVNLPGYEGHDRHFIEGRDLNHMFPGRPDGNDGEVFAHRLLDRIVSKFDFLLDLHTASRGRVNSLYVRAHMEQEITARMARLQRPRIILHNPPSDHTLRGAAEEMGIPAITVEIGNPSRFQPEYIRRSLAGIRAVLSDRGLLARRKVTEGPPPVVCESSSWLYTDHGGLLEVFPAVADRVREGEVIARLSNIFGDVTREYRAPVDAVVIGKSIDPVARTGARIAHLGIEASPQRFAPPMPSGPAAGDAAGAGPAE